MEDMEDMPHRHHHEAAVASEPRLRALRWLAGKATMGAAEHSETLTRTAELSCCGGVCPNCAPVMGLSLFSTLGRRIAQHVRFLRRHDQESH